MFILQKLLISCINLGEYVELYSDKNDLTKFIFGKIVFCDDSHIIILSITPEGMYDGYILKRIEDIVKICTRTNYIADMISKIDQSSLKQFVFNNSDSSIVGLLDFAKTNNLIVSIELLNSGYSEAFGFVNEINNNYIAIKQIDQSDKLDGITYVRNEDITQISMDSV